MKNITITQIAVWLDTLDECMYSQKDACNDEMLGTTALDVDYEWYCRLPPEMKINICREQYPKIARIKSLTSFYMQKSRREYLRRLEMRKAKEEKQKRKRLLASQIRKKREEKQANRKAKEEAKNA